MKTAFQPKIKIDPNKKDIELLKSGIHENNILVTGESTGNRDITFFIRNSDNEIIGGIRGTYNISGWLYINALWVDKNYKKCLSRRVRLFQPARHLNRIQDRIDILDEETTGIDKSAVCGLSQYT